MAGGMHMTENRHVIHVGSMQARERATSLRTCSVHTQKRRKVDKKSVSFAERLLRDCALCTAMMLCILGLGNSDQPVAAMTAQRLSQVATTDLETDEILGQLKFVYNLFPESVQVFWNTSDTTQRIGAPSQAKIIHAWAVAEPWVAYAESEEIFACDAGEVMSITPMDDGTYSMRIRHEGELESLYSQLSACMVREGETVAQGQVLGKAEQLLFEVRKEGRAIDPEALM